MSVNSPLLTVGRVGAVEVANRIAMAPMTRCRAGKSRVPNSIMAQHYVDRASAGLLITEATVIGADAVGFADTPGIYTDEMEAGWKNIVENVHKAGGKIFIQLWHCGRASHSSYLDGKLPVAPSAIAIQGDGIYTPTGKQPHETPRALELAEIPRIISQYQEAARRAKRAGFDGVEIHSANGYLLDEFLQSRTNQRTDQYGGSVQNRYRLLREVVEAILREIPANRLAVRLSPNGTYNDMGSADFREQFTYVASQLNQYGLAYLHVVDGLASGFHALGDPMTLADFRAVYQGALMGNCGYDIASGEAAIREGRAEMIAYGRPFISNPDFVERIRNDWPLAEMAPLSDWYSTTGAKGYNDYPAH